MTLTYNQNTKAPTNQKTISPLPNTPPSLTIPPPVKNAIRVKPRGPQHPMNAKWRAVYCKARDERRAHMHLLNQEYHSFLPLVRTRRKLRGRYRTCIEPMFPRYLFIQLADFREDWGPIRSTRGVVGLVRLGDEVPVVPDDLIAELSIRHDDGGAIDLTASRP